MSRGAGLVALCVALVLPLAAVRAAGPEDAVLAPATTAPESGGPASRPDEEPLRGRPEPPSGGPAPAGAASATEDPRSRGAAPANEGPLGGRPAPPSGGPALAGAASATEEPRSRGAAPASEGPFPAETAPPAAPSLIRVGAALFVTLACVLVVAWLLKRSPLGGRSGALRIESRLQVARGGSVAVVRAGGRRMLVGITTAQISLIADLGDGDPAEPAGSPRPSIAGSGAFERVLGALMGRRENVP